MFKGLNLNRLTAGLNINSYAGVNTSGPQPVNRRGDRTKALSIGQQLLVFGGILVGVILKPAIDTFKTGDSPDLKVTLPMVIVSIVISLVVLAQTYRKEGLHTDAPLIVQIGYAVQNGLFWHTLVSISQ